MESNLSYESPLQVRKFSNLFKISGILDKLSNDVGSLVSEISAGDEKTSYVIFFKEFNIRLFSKMCRFIPRSSIARMYEKTRTSSSLKLVLQTLHGFGKFI